jgi:hypothetical protein
VQGPPGNRSSRKQPEQSDDGLRRGRAIDIFANDLADVILGPAHDLGDHALGDQIAAACSWRRVLTLFSDKIISRMVAIRQPTTEFIGSAIV